jgi:hypothetical protein
VTEYVVKLAFWLRPEPALGPAGGRTGGTA